VSVSRIDNPEGMTTPAYNNSRAPLVTDAEIEERVDHLIGQSNLRKLWVLFLDPREVQIPLIIPINELPHAADDESAVSVITNVHEVADDVGAGCVVLVWERCGSEYFTPEDSVWARQIAWACTVVGVRLRAMLLSHRTGVRWIAPDDYLSQRPV
jgi:hypothetical protein